MDMALIMSHGQSEAFMDWNGDGFLTTEIVCYQIVDPLTLVTPQEE